MKKTIKLKALSQLKPISLLLILMAFLLVLNINSYAGSSSEEKIKNFLIFHSFHEDMPWVKSFNSGIKKFKTDDTYKIKFYYEYLDSSRLKYEPSSNDYINHITKKYSSIKVDAVIADSEHASPFIA